MLSPTSTKLAFLLLIVAAQSPSSDWVQPPIRTGDESVESLPWASNIQEALTRAAKEKKLVLATVVAITDGHWVSGYEGSEFWVKRAGKTAFGDDVASADDEGLRKERVMMATFFSDPDVVALVKKHFVPVRVRCEPFVFDGKDPHDPLDPLGTKCSSIGGPALVISKPDGTLVHAIGRIGVFQPALASRMLRAALAKAGVHGVASPPANTGRSASAADFVAKLGIQLEEWTAGAPLELDPLAKTTEVDASKAPIAHTLDRAAQALLALQSDDGGWQNPAFDIRVSGGRGTTYDYEVPRTALVVDALLRLRARLPQRKAELEAAARRGIEIVGKFADAPQPWIWQLTYALHLQVELLQSDLDDQKEKAKERAGRLVNGLLGIQESGGWTYMALPTPRVHSFNTAPVLLLLGELQKLGVDVPTKSIDEGRAFLTSLRNPAEERDYWYAPTMKFEPRASGCRSALCELALMQIGDKGALNRLVPAIDFFFETEPGARAVTKVYESFLSSVALQDAYHYYFGHYYVARAFERLPKEVALNFARQQQAILLKQVEADGSFVDAQAQGKSYSTAMALLALLIDLRYTNP